MLNLKDLLLEDYPAKTFDKIRYADTDRQGHVNNSNFSTFLETGRVELLYNAENPLTDEDCSFVIAKIDLNLISEIKWPGLVDIGTGISRIGNSSVSVSQSLFQNGSLCATAETVVVQVNDKKGGSTPLTERAKSILDSLKLKEDL